MREVDSTKAFYHSVFGWAFTDWGPDYIGFAGAGVDGGFSKQNPVSEAGVLVVLYADDLENTLERVQTAGGKISKAIFSFPGGRRFHFIDPNGNELAVWSQ